MMKLNLTNVEMRPKLTLQEKVKISNQEKENFTEEEKKELEKMVQEYLNKECFEMHEKAKANYRLHCRNELRRKYAQDFLEKIQS